MIDRYAAIECLSREPELSVAQACAVLEVSRAGYYEWLRHAPSPRQQQTEALTPVVREIFWRHRRRYGARRIAAELADRELPCSPQKVAKIMQNQGLRALQPKSFKPKTTESRHRLGYSPNLLLDLPPLDRLNQLWVGDISYVPLVGGQFCYLALLMDRYSRVIVGWNLAETMQEALVLRALQAAIRARQPGPGWIHHTDRGGQYAGQQYRAVLRRAACSQSMNRPDNCYDNAFMESCFGTIKNELQMTEYIQQQKAEQEIGEYLHYYNHDRKHSSLEYLTPVQFECQLTRKK